MEEVIWVEVLSRHRDVVARYRCGGPTIYIGRDYANDVVIDDPYVAPRHLRILRDEAGALIAEDLGSANGMFVDPGSQRLNRVVLDGDRPIRIGHTYLRVRNPGHAVQPERLDAPQARMWPAMAVLGAAVLGIEAASVWLSETTEPQLSRYLRPILTVAVLLAIWTAVWAVLSRVFSGQARFERNLLIALSGLLVYSIFNEFVDFAGFSLSWRALTTYQFVGMWSLLAVVCFLHLREIGSSWLKLKGAAVAALLAVAIGMQILNQSEVRTGFDQQSYARRLLPPMLRLAPSRNETTFFADVEELKSRLDHDRTEDLPSGAKPTRGSQE